MSKITKLPISRKENKPSIMTGRGDRPGVSNIRLAGISNTCSCLNDADKKSLLLNHTKLVVKGPATSAPAPRIKRAATIPAPSIPAKISKVEVKPPTVTRKIPPYDYKARFIDLETRHKAMREQFIGLKDKHVEITDDYEKIKETAESSSQERDQLRLTLNTTLSDLKDKMAEFGTIKIDYEKQKCENEALQRQTKVLQEVADTLKKKSAEYDTLKKEFDDLNRRHLSLKDETEALRVLTDHLKKISIEHDSLQIKYKEATDIIAKYKSETEILQNILASMYKEQRDLRNTVQDLKGNIRVYCRVRPALDSESSKPLFILNVLDACSIEVEKVELNCNALSSRKGKQLQSFTFDGIFTPHSAQEDVFAEVSPMIQSALDGYNVCIFAYGQTGSGKTFTMEGGNGREQYGIIPRATNMIFTCMDDLKRMGWELTIKVSFLEIYNEVIYDLLATNKEQPQHDIKMVNSKGNDIYVSNLKEEEVQSAHEFIRYLIFAQRNRQTAATINNDRSSRSHSVTQIKISAINEKRKEKFTSNLNLVDLAGSESGKFSQRMDETKHINRSLSELSKVILSLQKNQAHIPYRNSKLTHLLMPSLGGNSKTLMLVNINQFDECFNETLNSLRFATTVNNCRTVKAKKNITMVDQV